MEFREVFQVFAVFDEVFEVFEVFVFVVYVCVFFLLCGAVFCCGCTSKVVASCIGCSICDCI